MSRLENVVTCTAIYNHHSPANHLAHPIVEPHVMTKTYNCRSSVRRYINTDIMSLGTKHIMLLKTGY